MYFPGQPGGSYDPVPEQQNMQQERVVGSAYWDLRQSRLISRGSGVGYTWPRSSSTTHETSFLISFFFSSAKWEQWISSQRGWVFWTDPGQGRMTAQPPLSFLLGKQAVLPKMAACGGCSYPAPLNSYVWWFKCELLCLNSVLVSYG